MFRAAVRIHVAEDITPEKVQITLEQLPDEIIVDFTTRAGEGL